MTYYPGYRLRWYAIAALVVLRLAVGWHFLYEGLSKIESHRQELTPFSAEGYLGNASGPFRDYFRAQVGDPFEMRWLDPEQVSAEWQRTLAEFDRRYELTEEQEQAAREKIAQLEVAKAEYFEDQATQARIAEYRAKIDKLLEDERSDLDFERKAAQARREQLAETREEVIGPVEAWNRELAAQLQGLLTEEQREAGTEAPRNWLARNLGLPFDLAWPDRRIEQITLMTMLGLTIVGGLLLVGLFSRFSALLAALFLAMVYLANPPPPLGLGNPADPGNYAYVNKELVECLAALVLATIPTGRWLGLDALIRGLFTRRISARLFGPADDVPRQVVVEDDNRVAV